jgi:holo-[acyl-carrier protein] synthase
VAESIGIDIVEVPRIKRAIDRYGDRFVSRLLGPRESARLSERQDRAAFVAGRFAAKEAVIKALGAYLDARPPYRELQIVNDATGRPAVLLPDELTDKLAHVNILISISHERNHAVAMAICSEKK